MSAPRLASQAQNWRVPLPARITLGLALAAIIALIAVAALGTRYRLATRTGLAGCIGITALDVLMISGVLFAAPAMTWATIAAIAASTARITFSTTTLRPLLGLWSARHQ